METALQQAIISITESKQMLEKQLESEENEIARAMLNMTIISNDNTLQLLHSLIPAEKEQINSAYYDGWYDKEKQIDQDYTIQFNDDYYSQTYQSK